MNSFVDVTAYWWNWEVLDP